MQSLISLISFLIVFSFQLNLAKKPTFTAGASSSVINPPEGAFIAGDKQNRHFTGVNDSLFVKAVVVKNGDSAVAILTFDCIGLLYSELEKIREKVSDISDFPVERIVISSTHTHSGPDVVGIWGEDYQHSGVDPNYIEFLVNTAAEQLVKADQNRREAEIFTAETQFGEPWAQNICNEEIDRSVSIIQFKDKKGKSIASLTNFACHPTFMDAVFTEVSADYVGGFYKALDKSWGGVNLFLQGPIGGWVQPVIGKGDLKFAMEKGDELASAVISAMKTGQKHTQTSILFRSKTVKFPVSNDGWKQLSHYGIIPRKIQDLVQTEIVWFEIGQAKFATHPGETAPYYGLETKKLMGTGPKFVLGLSQDALGYILKPVYFEDSSLPHAEYLTRMSVGPETGPLIMQTLQDLSKAD